MGNSGKPDKSVRPPWDTAIIAPTPAFADPTIEEVKSFASSLGRNLMTGEQRFIEQALREEGNARANIASLLTSGGSQERITENMRSLAQALKRLGRFAEAAEIVINSDGNPLPALESTLDDIKKYYYAVEVDDGEMCDCPRPVATVPDARGKDVALELNRRVALGQVYSPKHGKVVSVWECTQCNTPNAHDRIPERQVKLHEFRGIVAGATSAAFNEAEYKNFSGARDEALLKPTGQTLP